MQLNDERGRDWTTRDSAAVAVLIAVAVLLRAAFYTGFFGSDEVIYTGTALKILAGDWAPSDYIGSLRYGINLPVAFFLWVFGVSDVSANLWSFLCSVAEVALVYFAGWMLWGTAAAFFSGAVIAMLPLHVHYAGRLMADAPLAALLTLSFVLFLLGQRTRDPRLFFASGLASGAALWVKQSATVVYWGAFGAYALIRRTWNWQWLWVAAGVAVLGIANLGLMWVVAGDPLHILRVMSTGMEQFVESTVVETSPAYYFRYLFLDLRHTWLLGYLAVTGAAVAWWHRKRAGTGTEGLTDVLIWGLSLVAIFSFLVVSVNPLKLISKQTNYMLMFIAPLCLLAGYFLASLSGWWRVTVLAAYAAGAVLLSGLEQQAIRVFTANSKTAVHFANSQPGIPVFGMTGAHRAGLFAVLMEGLPPSARPIRHLSELAEEGVRERLARQAEASGLLGYAIIDLQTAEWGDNPIRSLREVPSCWRLNSTLQPAPETGLGRLSVEAVAAVSGLLPMSLTSKLAGPLSAVSTSKPAYVYEIPADCAFSVPRGRRAT